MKIRFLTVLPFVLLILSCGSKEKPLEPQPISVKVMKVEGSANAVWNSYSGSVEAAVVSPQSFVFGGTVTKIYVTVGQKVKKGQILATIDNRQAKNEYAEALSEVRTAKDTYTRYNNMYVEKAMPEAQWMEAKGKLEQAQARLAMVEKSVKDCSLYAALSGVVTSRDAEAGQNVTAGETVVEISDMGRVKVDFNVAAKDISSFHTGQQMTIIAPDLDNRQYTALVSEINPEGDGLSHTYSVKGIVNNSDNKLLPGMIVKSKKHASTDAVGPQKIVVADNLVQLETSNKRFVWVVRKGVAARQPVVIGEALSNGVVIKEGLQPGDVVVVKGHQKLSEGCKVKIE